MLIDASTLTDSISLRCDYLIIGTGAGGAVIGHELAKKGHSVVFLEEGASHPSSTHRDLASQAVARLYRNRGMTMALGKSFFPVPLGKALGGTTVINSGTTIRPPHSILSKWINPDEIIPHFTAIENALPAAPAGTGVMSKSNQLIQNIFKQKKYPGEPLIRNAPECSGCGMCCYGCTSGAKRSMEVSFIPQAIAHGAQIYTHARAEEILGCGGIIDCVIAHALTENGKKTGVTITLYPKHTIIAAGTLLTPILLRRNRLSASPQLGRNLTLHPASKVYAEFDDDLQSWEGIPQAYGSHLLEDEGILFEGVFIPPDLAASMTPFEGQGIHDFMRSYRKMATFGFMIEDSTTGRVIDLPALGPTFFYNLTPEDAQRAQRATAFLARLFLELGAKRVIPLIRCTYTELRTEADIQGFEKLKIQPTQLEVAAFHPLGTARMGQNSSCAVVDQNQKVFGWENLYVSDGSVIPTALGANPQLTIMALARRLAHHLS